MTLMAIISRLNKVRKHSHKEHKSPLPRSRLDATATRHRVLSVLPHAPVRWRVFTFVNSHLFYAVDNDKLFPFAVPVFLRMADPDFFLAPACASIAGDHQGSQSTIALAAVRVTVVLSIRMRVHCLTAFTLHSSCTRVSHLYVAAVLR